MKMTIKVLVSITLLSLLAGIARVDAADNSKLTVEMFRGGFATVNSFIFSNGKSLVIMDVQRKLYEAEKLVKRIRRYQLPVTHILITHGHTDHFTGMPLMRDEFPDAKIVVSREAVKRDIKAYALYMDSFGSTEEGPILEPRLKPRSDNNPDGFDYENWIHVLPGKTLEIPGGGVLELTDNYPRTEAPHMTTAYSADLNALFLSDLGYNEVHHWQGDDISWSDIANWRQALIDIRTRYQAVSPIVYPGHGEPTDLSLVEQMVGYMDNYRRAIEQAGSIEQARDIMIGLYPDHGEADFFLKYSLLNHFPAKDHP